jgi:hypothetical protein
MRAALLLSLALPLTIQAADPPPVVTDIDYQPLAANAERVEKTLEFLGTPLAKATSQALAAADQTRDVRAIQKALDPLVLVVVTINPESRVKANRGPTEVKLQQAGYTPVLFKVVNESTVKKPLRVMSPQSGPVYGLPTRTAERDPNYDPKAVQRFAQVEMYDKPPMTKELSGLTCEYVLGLIYSTEAGKREITLGFDVGQGNQDLGFRGEVPILFDIAKAIPVKMKVLDVDGTPTVGRFTFKDDAGRVYPPQAKRLTPDLFFQQQIYRSDGGTVLLPPGELTMTYGRGPEYHLIMRKERIGDDAREIAVKLTRWVNPAEYGFYSGDHHIHAAGCQHYTNPTEGIFPEDMFLHVKGEGLNVGCCLTWGPCYDYQRKFFAAGPWERSEPFTVLKYDVEVSGFGSQALGHVCLLNLKDQTYPGSDGTKTKGWPTWTTPLMKWAKAQGAYTGYAHSANGLAVRPEKSAPRLFAELDTAKKGFVTKEDVANGKLPLTEPFEKVNADGDGRLTEAELRQSTQRVMNTLPNLAIPEMDGIGAQEICVTSALGVCDFISAMDTARVPEWNCWYHIMNCGFPLKVSGETDFPCITGHRVGQGRVYVQLGKVSAVNFADWCKGLAQGRSYVSDGYAHALKFAIGDKTPGTGDVKLAAPGTVTVDATVAFARYQPLDTSIGGKVGDSETRTVEVVMNGQVVGKQDVPADGQPHDVKFQVAVMKSGWIALRCFPQLHTNPVNVIVADKPIRASKDDAKWCLGTIEQLWRVREKNIAPDERAAAKKAFDEAIAIYKKIAAESD